MAGTKNRRPTVKTVLRWIQAGYGQGEGEAFKPFMYVRDVPSEGTSSMVSSRGLHAVAPREDSSEQ